MRGRTLRLTAIMLSVVGVSTACAATDSAPVMVPPTGIPATIVHDGQTLYYRGTEPFRRPVLDESDPAVLHLQADNSGDNLNCKLTPVAHTRAQTATQVSVLITTYGAVKVKPSGVTVCDASSAGAVDETVRLDLPLGHRALLDAGDQGAVRAVLDPATVPELTTLPAGFRPTDVQWGDEPSAAVRNYTSEYDTLILTRTADTGRADVHGPKVVRRFSIHGHPALMTIDPGFDEDFLVQWQPDPQTLIELYQGSGWPTHPGLSADQMQALAESVQLPH